MIGIFNSIMDSDQKIITDGLRIHWDAAQLRSYPGSGTTWFDISGNGINTSLVNGPTFNSEFGGSIKLDGINDQIESPYNTLLTATQTATVWCRSTNAVWNQDRSISVPFASSCAHRIYSVINTKNVTFIISDRFFNEYTIGTITLSDITIPHMYSITTNGSNLHKAYIDGVEVASISTSISRIDDTVGRQWFLGADPSASNRRLNGYFYNALIYNRELSATEVLQNYDAIKSRFGL